MLQRVEGHAALSVRRIIPELPCGVRVCCLVERDCDENREQPRRSGIGCFLKIHAERLSRLTKVLPFGLPGREHEQGYRRSHHDREYEHQCRVRKVILEIKDCAVMAIIFLVIVV